MDLLATVALWTVRGTLDTLYGQGTEARTAVGQASAFAGLLLSKLLRNGSNVYKAARVCATYNQLLRHIPVSGLQFHIESGRAAIETGSTVHRYMTATVLCSML